jgi:hypothetical protein
LLQLGRNNVPSAPSTTILASQRWKQVGYHVPLILCGEVDQEPGCIFPRHLQRFGFVERNVGVGNRRAEKSAFQTIEHGLVADDGNGVGVEGFRRENRAGFLERIALMPKPLVAIAAWSM